MKNPFDFTTSEILQSELDAIHLAIVYQELDITPHAEREAIAEKIPLVSVLEAVFVGRAVSKDLPDNDLNRVAGINFEHQMDDKRWIRAKVSWIKGFFVITVHTI
jgi:hypothetical protein